MMSTISGCFINYDLQVVEYHIYIYIYIYLFEIAIKVFRKHKYLQKSRRNNDLHTWTSYCDRIFPFQWMWCRFGSLFNPISLCLGESNVSRTQLLFPKTYWLLFLDEQSNWKQSQLRQLFFLYVLPSSNALPNSDNFFLSYSVSFNKLLLAVGSVTARPSTENLDLSSRNEGILPHVSWIIP